MKFIYSILLFGLFVYFGEAQNTPDHVQKSGKVVAARKTEIKKAEVSATKENAGKPKVVVDPKDTVPSICCGTNVFTPNDDGTNDTFTLPKMKFLEMNVIMVDRWGNVVYEANKVTTNQVWNGKDSKGKNCEEGTYFYLIKGKGNDGAVSEVKGTVSLFR